MTREQQARAEAERIDRAIQSRWQHVLLTHAVKSGSEQARQLLSLITQEEIASALLTFSKAPEGTVIDDKGRVYKVKFSTPAGSPSPIGGPAPCVQFYCEPAAHPTGGEVEG